LPDVPTVATDRHVPAAFPPTPDLSAPDHQVLYPDAMIKLAPPADDMEPALGKMKEMAVVEGGIARLPLNSLDHLVGDQVPAQRTRSRSQQLLGIPCAVDPVASARGKSASPRPKPPKRSHTAHPSHSFRSSTPSGPDVRIRLQSNVSGLPRSKFSPLGPNSASSSMHRSYTSESVTPRFLSVPIEHSASDFGPSDGVEAKIAFLGDPSVGKTSMIMRYIKKRYIADPSATIQGTLYISKIIANGVKVKLQIWDTAGQERFGNMTALYYRHSHVCVLVYDVSNRQTFLDLKEVLDELKDRVPDAAIYIVGHKSDREANRAV
jgi:small GTP-binding protein